VTAELTDDEVEAAAANLTSMAVSRSCTPGG
jgi:hypothetical protein